MRRLISFGTMGLLAILLAFCSVVLAQDKLKQMFPDSEVVWERKLEKGIASFAVAKASGDIAAISVGNGEMELRFLDKTGKLRWKRQFKGRAYFSKPPEVSDNGEVVCVYGWGRRKLNLRTWVFDKTGELLFSVEKKHTFFYPSPDGNYFVEEGEAGLTREFPIYDRHGKLVWEIPPEGFGGDIFACRFVGKDHLLVYSADYSAKESILRLVTFPELETVWSYALEYPIMVFTTFQHTNTAIAENRIAFFGDIQRPWPPIYLFDMSGNLLWKRNDIRWPEAIALSDDGKFTVVVNANPRGIYIIDNESQQILVFHQLARSDPYFVFLNSSIFFSDPHKLIISGFARKKMISYFCRFDKYWKIVHESYEEGLVRPFVFKTRKERFLLRSKLGIIQGISIGKVKEAR